MAIRPEYVMQSDTQRCWAACMESWTAAAWYWTRINQGVLVGLYSDNSSGGLMAGGVKYREFLLRFDLKEYIIPAGGLEEKLVKRWMDLMGYFIVIMESGTGSHAMLAYDASGGQLQVMDPARGYQKGALGDLGKALCLHMVP
jgi:hypothetical protein